jgi:hypothetical protein
MPRLTYPLRPHRVPFWPTSRSVGAIYANTSVQWDGFPKSIGLAALLVIVPIFAGIGNIFWNWIHERRWMTAKAIMRVNLLMMALVPAYGLLNFADKTLGYVRFWHLYIGVIVYGWNLGSIQAFSRSAYGAMIPEGLEANLYSLYNVTDRGSSWIGPAVVAAVINNTGTVKLAFTYPLVMLVVPSVLITFVDFRKAEEEAKEYARVHKTANLAMRGSLSVASMVGGGGGGGDRAGKDSEGVALVSRGATAGVDSSSILTPGISTVVATPSPSP